MIYALNSKSLLFKYISYNLNNFYDSSLEISDTYSLDLARCIYSFLSDSFPQQYKYNSDGSVLEEMEDISQYYLNKSKIYNKIIYSENETLQNNQLPVYDYDNPVTPEDISDINKYNIYTWDIDDYIIQYLQPGVVINDVNTVDEIAQAQISLEVLNYKPENIGTLDDNFSSLCYDIQVKLKQNNPSIISTGYYDIYVESYARLIGESI